MIRIDRISFEFAMNDEPFAYSLYANWDSFCRTCFEDIVEECFSEYDKDKVLHEIETIDLDLGSIPEEDFYREFPLRLKEQLLKVLPSLNVPEEGQKERTRTSRIGNLLFYLEHGYQQTEWADSDFSLSEELDWAVLQQTRYADEIVKLCLGKEYALRRLLWQTDDEEALVRLYSTALSTAFCGVNEKRRFLKILLEMKPGIPVRFIHETTDNAELYDMAELLDTLSVCRIMEAETEEHAEVNLLPYWHYLYEWLVRYYPFNGLAIFGGKGDFIRHLHHRLLTFIHKRNYSFYLSRTELTAAFLLEVFGPAYYIEVLNAIYDLQPHHVDGSPMYDGYLNRELYRIFLQLSLLQRPVTEEKLKEESASGKEKEVYQKLFMELSLPEKYWEELAEKKEMSLSVAYLRKLKTILANKSVPESIKRRMLALLLEESEDGYADILLLLNEQGLLEDALGLMSQPVLEEIIRQSVLIQSLLESHCSTDEDFTSWLEDGAVSADNKQELLQKLVVEKTQEWICLLRRLPEDSRAVTFVATRLSASRLLQGMARADFYQASVLLRTVEWLQRSADRHAFLTRSGMPFSTALSKALLLYMQDKDTLGGRTLTESEMIYKFLSYLHLTYTGKTDYRDDAQWTDLSGKMAADLGADDWQEMQEREIAEFLLYQDTSDTVFSRNLISLIKRQPEQLLAWLEKDVDPSLIKRIAATSDRMMSGQWTAFLSTSSGFGHPDAFRRLLEGIHRITGDRTSDMVSVLLSWLKETDWRKQTPEQMEDYFVSRLFGTNALHLPMERIMDTALPENIRRRLLHNYIRFQPQELSDYIRQSVERNVLPLKIWMEWLNIRDWMRLTTNRSLLWAELLHQMMAYLSKSRQAKEADLRTALASCVLNNRAGEWIYNSREETIRSFVRSLPFLQKKTDIEIKKMVQNMQEELNLENVEDSLPKGEQMKSPDILLIGNAGLCLLAPWFLKLFDLLGYLNEDKKDFKDTVSKVRAIFLLQYLTCSEEKEYRETELAFNRLLVSLPMYLPLPGSLELTDKEKQTAESMLTGVKANWQAMRGTSLKGFQESFIIRRGRLEQQEEKWLLTVDNLTIDILLDTVRWGFRQIRFPWLKKYVQVVWHEKQEF